MPDRRPMVLVIDDEKTIRDGAKGVLEHVGFSVLVADNGRSGIEVFAQHAQDIAVVLLDLTMPVMRGEEALEELLRIRPDTQCLLMSGYTEEEAVHHLTNLSFSGFLQKPFGMEDLIERVKGLLEQT